MKRESEDPAGYLSCLPTSYLGSPHHIPCAGQRMDPSYRIAERERETREIDVERKNPSVAPGYICKHARGWVRVQEMIKGTEKTRGRHRSELLQPLDNHHLAIPDTNTADEDIETIYDEGGIEANECRNRCEVFQG